MGDHPSNRKRIGNELTDNIFEPPLKNVKTIIKKFLILKLKNNNFIYL